MRIRTKPWVHGELAACSFFVADPAQYRGKWRDSFAKKYPLHIELGCGKGGFLSKISADNPEINYLGVDIKSEMLGLAKRKIEAEFATRDKTEYNVKIMSHDIERIFLMLAPQDEIKRIYINFCNPWPKPRQHKKRLTHTRQLVKYNEFVADGCELHFKTDDDDLFYDTLSYIEQAGLTLKYKNDDISKTPIIGNIETEHEKMYLSRGKTIKHLVAVFSVKDTNQ